ncbi:MAG: hypothetical protein K1W15_03795 [Lachnospiraceae bacterium]
MFNKPEVLMDGFNYLDATRLEEIQRNLGCLYGTAEGTCPGDRHFGIDQSFESYPLNVAQNLFALEVIEKTEEYESRAEILDISFSYEEDGNMTPRITIGLKDMEEDDAEDEE